MTAWDGWKSQQSTQQGEGQGQIETLQYESLEEEHRKGNPSNESAVVEAAVAAVTEPKMDGSVDDVEGLPELELVQAMRHSVLSQKAIHSLLNKILKSRLCV